MRLTISRPPAPHRTFCYECGSHVDELVLVEIGIGHGHGPNGGSYVSARLCQRCRLKLFNLLRLRERKLKRRIVAALAAVRAGATTEPEIKGIVGKYATNTLKSVRARGFLDVVERPGQPNAYRLTDRGVAALEASYAK